MLERKWGPVEAGVSNLLFYVHSEQVYVFSHFRR